MMKMMRITTATTSKKREEKKKIHPRITVQKEMNAQKGHKS